MRVITVHISFEISMYNSKIRWGLDSLFDWHVHHVLGRQV